MDFHLLSNKTEHDFVLDVPSVFDQYSEIRIVLKWNGTLYEHIWFHIIWQNNRKTRKISDRFFLEKKMSRKKILEKKIVLGSSTTLNPLVRGSFDPHTGRFWIQSP